MMNAVIRMSADMIEKDTLDDAQLEEICQKEGKTREELRNEQIVWNTPNTGYHHNLSGLMQTSEEKPK